MFCHHTIRHPLQTHDLQCFRNVLPARNLKSQTVNLKTYAVLLSVFFLNLTKKTLSCPPTGGRRKVFRLFCCYISLLVPSSYQYHIGDVPYMFHMYSIYVPYIFQYYIDMEHIWNTIGKWIDYLLFRSVMMATSSRVSGERNEFSVWSLKSLKSLKFERFRVPCLRFLLTTRSLIIIFLAEASGSINISCHHGNNVGEV